MSLVFIRIIFIIVSIVVGYQVGAPLMVGERSMALAGALFGLLGALFIIILEAATRRVSLRGLSAAVFGLIFGLIMAKLVSDAIALLPLNQTVSSSSRVVLTWVFCYLGMVLAMRGRDEFNLVIPYVKFVRQDQGETVTVLDTSAIIDGRIADLCQTKFLEGKMVVPRFVLKELHRIADSADSTKRNRGRRGLDILHKLRKDANLDVRIHEEDFPEISEVDGKLVKLAKIINAKVFTTDFSLNRIAEFQGVKVLNVNELAQALRPVVLPGEDLSVRLIKEGKEHNQAVGYLEDGTMVVVEEARRLIGQQLKVKVTSVLQTQAGRMIFAKPY